MLPGPRLVCVASCAGGVGKTTLAVEIATLVAARARIRTIDGDEGPVRVLVLDAIEAKRLVANGEIAFARATPGGQDDGALTSNADGTDIRAFLPGFTSGSPPWSSDRRDVAVASGSAFPAHRRVPATVIVDPVSGTYLPMSRPERRNARVPLASIMIRPIWSPRTGAGPLASDVAMSRRS